ncbi:osmoprotectant transport system substrate-binding protein [Geodermatophilus obscurus]|jgi:osmoprotectant transport system substrate-binding protein|uniref:Osmoprotectant transport system substrate-binding protein n=1 Tax=Geodermatophilus obscurus TaxID=1861 RepID=A0A1I5F252_9ACTN|nr:ABC transporter substrate-binding protein [Geodermatophilus obscurus]SFO17401.1 osmoprotectant transport system substrate-binding protein [Geodermatophilus obscurus]
MRRRPLLVSLVVAAVLCGCAGVPADPGPPPDPGVRIASYDFPENQTLAEVYAEALRRAGFEVTVQHGIGTREVVFPALEQGVVDVVVEYLGAAAEFVAAGAGEEPEPDPLRGLLAAALEPRGLTVLAAAEAEDQNGFVVLTDLAEQHGMTTLSQLAAVAPGLVFGGPPECAERRFCLPGLQEVYGIEFAEVRNMPSRSATVEALLSGQVDVGMLETTDARLTDAALLLLRDDRALQPRENVVPVVRTEVAEEAGPRLAAALDAVSAQLTTIDLITLNRAVAVDGLSPRDAALRWWDGR